MIQVRVRHLVAACLLTCAGALPADLLELVNGDRYFGHVTEVNETRLRFRSAILGEITLNRDLVFRITFRVHADSSPFEGEGTPVPSVSVPAGVSNPAPAPSTGSALEELRRKGPDAEALAQVQEQFLKGAGPAAQQQFSTLMQGLMSGAMSMDDLREKAEESVSQLKEAQEMLGEDAGSVVEGYLNILQGFLSRFPASDSKGNRSSPPKALDERDSDSQE